MHVPGWLQHAAAATVESRLFEGLVVLIILANCVTMALDAPTGVPASEQALLDRLNLCFLCAYTVELFVRTCATGGRLHSRWAVFEASIVGLSWLADALPMESRGFTAIVRCFRALRVLFLFERVPGMRALCMAALCSLPAMTSVGSLCAFIIGVMAVVGVQLFQGALHLRCADASTGLDTGILCGKDAGSCAAGTRCVRFASNPAGEASSFDSVAEASLPLLQTFLLDGWSESMYRLQVSASDCS